MPYHTQALPESGCLLVRAEGDLALPEMVDAVARWAEMLVADPRLRVLVVDHLAARVGGIEPADVKAVADQSAAMYEACPDLFAVAIYAETLDYGYGRMWQTWVDGDDRAFITRTREEAEGVLRRLGFSIDLDGGASASQSAS